MKNFNREYAAFALCGLNCGLCPMYHMENPCPGCGGGEGNQSCATPAAAWNTADRRIVPSAGSFPAPV